MPDTFVRTRCVSCEKVMTFEDFSAGGTRCLNCSRIVRRKPAPQLVRGPRHLPESGYEPDVESYERMLESVPDELIDELVAALEAEAAKMPQSPRSAVREVLDEIGVGQTTRGRQWAAWGFAAGFAGNVVIAKYAQMATGAPFSQFVVPLLIGGVVAGVCCSAITWGLARLREPG